MKLMGLMFLMFYLVKLEWCSKLLRNKIFRRTLFGNFLAITMMLFIMPLVVEFQGYRWHIYYARLGIIYSILLLWRCLGRWFYWLVLMLVLAYCYYFYAGWMYLSYYRFFWQLRRIIWLY